MGFFTNNELSKKAKQKINIEMLQASCKECGAYKDTRTKRLSPIGLGGKKVLIVGDYPSQDDDFNCTQLHGRVGEILQERARLFGLVINKDCWKVNAIRCVLPADVIEAKSKKDRFNKYIKFCRPLLEKTILELKPDYVLLLGGVSVAAAFGDAFGTGYDIKRWRGLFIKDEHYKCTFFATMHPRESVENQSDRGLRALIDRDLDTFFKAVRHKKEQYEEKPDYTSMVKILTDFTHTNHILDRIIREKLPVYFDYETTGLKPFRSGHKIALIGFALNESEAYVIPFQYKNTWTPKELAVIKEKWLTILSDPKILKSAHNIKFEDVWSSVIIGSRIKGAEWCTLMGTHILDNRAAFSRLKFQSFIRFGIRPYDTEIAPFLEAHDGEFNRVFEAPAKDLMIYCGLDCIFGIRLKRFQQHEFSFDKNKGMLNAFKFFKSGLGVMSEMQLNGVMLNEEHYLKEQESLRTERDSLLTKIMDSKEARSFQHKYNRHINLRSNYDLGDLYFGILGYHGEKTANGKWKTDKNALSRIKNQFTYDLAKYKKLNKMHDTYYKGMLTEYVNGRIHPFFDLHVPATYRSSSSNPNFQNLPKRDEEAKRGIRSGIVPDPGCVILEIDFSGAEVNTSCAYHKDPNFYNYLIDPTTDMHRDSACDLFKLPAEMMHHKDFTAAMKKLAKKIRNEAKNKWVFAEFYGDWYDSCGRSLYETCYKAKMELPTGGLLSDWMDDHGIGDLDDFLAHCKEAERILWEDRFPVYTQWKKDIYEFYVRNGYIDTYLGFRFQGYMDRKQATNYPIQGTSFHLLVSTLIEVSKRIRKMGLKTKLIMQIHDSLIASVPVNEIGIFSNMVNGIITSLHTKYRWMNVPMKAEAEISLPYEDGGTLYKMFGLPEIMMETGKVNLPEIYKA